MKYILTDTKIEWYGITLYRIKRLRDGMIGGWVESIKNLSQKGECFIYGEAKVYGNAVVSENAVVSMSARVCGNASISGNACVTEDAFVSGDTRITGDSVVSGRSYIYGRSRILGKAKIQEYAKISGDANIGGVTKVGGTAHITEGTFYVGHITQEYSDIRIYTTRDNILVTALLTNDGWLFNIGDKHNLSVDDFINHVQTIDKQYVSNS